MPTRLPRILAALLLTWATFAPSSTHASELRLRKDLVTRQADRVLIVAHGRFDHVKDTVNSLTQDCDLHAPVRVDEIKVAVVSEFMNACSTGLQPDQVRAFTENGPAEIAGVFRIWFEHPGKKDQVLSEEDTLAPYTSSNPPHAIQIHPIVRAGGQSFTAAIAPVEKDGKQFKAKGAPQLQTLLKRKITVQEFDGEDGDPYISIDSGCCLPNYFKLTAVLTSAPTKIDDGHSALANITSGQTVVASSLRLLSIDGTQADATFKTLKKNATLTFWGITRMNGAKILQLAEQSSAEPVKIPVEFVLFDVQK